MKIIARLIGFTVIGLVFLAVFMELMQFNVRMNELNQVSSTAMNQTQIVMREQIEDRFFNYTNARETFNSNDDYVQYFENCLKKLISSDSKYSYTVYGVDYTKGILSVGVDCTYKKISGEEKTIHTRKTSIVDVLIGDGAEEYGE